MCGLLIGILGASHNVSFRSKPHDRNPANPLSSNLPPFNRRPVHNGTSKSFYLRLEKPKNLTVCKYTLGPPGMQAKEMKNP